MIELQQLFGEQPFLEAEARARGFTPRELRHPSLAAPHRGVRSLQPPGDSLADRALAFIPCLRPGERFSHATALALLGCPIRVSLHAPIDVEAPPGATPVRRAGVRGHRSSLGSATFMLSIPDDDRTVPIVPPHLALFQSCTSLPFTETVVAIDSLVDPRNPHFDPTVALQLPLLQRWSEELSGRRGARRFRAAVALARVGSESRMETLTRLAGERAGLTGLTLQFTVLDRQGAPIGRFDLADQASRTLNEFDGEQHRLNRRQYLRDLDRYDRAREAGWRILRFHREDVLDRAEETGARMVAATGRAPIHVPVELRRLLDERADGETRPA